MQIPIFIIGLTVFILLSCTDGMKDQLNSEITVNPQPVMEIEVPQTINFNDKLEFSWRISRSSDVPTYIYSSILKQPAFAEIVVDSKEKTIEVYFTRLDRLPSAPYYFPPTQFSAIDPHQPFEGEFMSDRTVGEKGFYKEKNENIDGQAMVSGKWKVRAAIAYGFEFVSVTNEIADKMTQSEHPVNLVVNWQKIVFSDFKTVSVGEKK